MEVYKYIVEVSLTASNQDNKFEESGPYKPSLIRDHTLVLEEEDRFVRLATGEKYFSLITRHEACLNQLYYHISKEDYLRDSYIYVRLYTTERQKKSYFKKTVEEIITGKHEMSYDLNFLEEKTI